MSHRSTAMGPKKVMMHLPASIFDLSVWDFT